MNAGIGRRRARHGTHAVGAAATICRSAEKFSKVRCRRRGIAGAGKKLPPLAAGCFQGRQWGWHFSATTMQAIENINKLNDGMSFAYRLRACRRFGIAAAKTDYHKVRCPNDSYQHQCQSVVRTQCAERK
jgi:hypothetical protein